MDDRSDDGTKDGGRPSSANPFPAEYTREGYPANSPALERKVNEVLGRVNLIDFDEEMRRKLSR